MSNTPVLVDEAMSVISAGSYAGEEHLRLAEELLRPVGKVLRMPESQQDAATALSGSGPGVRLLPGRGDGRRRHPARHAARRALEMVIQTVYGAATMLRDSGEHPVILREAVTSPGGTTIAAIRGAGAARGARRLPGRARGGPRPRPGAGRRILARAPTGGTVAGPLSPGLGRRADRLRLRARASAGAGAGRADHGAGPRARRARAPTVSLLARAGRTRRARAGARPRLHRGGAPGRPRRPGEPVLRARHRRRPGVRRHARGLRAGRGRHAGGGPRGLDGARRSTRRTSPAACTTRCAGSASGFCVYNDPAIAISAAAGRGRRRGSPTSTSTSTTATACRPPSTTTRGC